jgi:glycosyltransferase involved in cell wall biosynthesis
MKYVISVLNEITENETVVVSPCATTLYKYVKGSTTKIEENVSLKTFGSFNGKHRMVRILGHALTRMQFVLFLLTHVKSTDTVIVYHSLALMRIVKALKNIKKCRLIIEVEELYANVREDNRLCQKEIQYLQTADRYIVITELLNKQVNLQNKPKIISHGTYRTVPKYGEKFEDGKIHVVYAGSFNPIKGGAISAIEAAAFLDDTYVLHILGRGTPSQNEMIIHKIAEISQKTECEIVFEGYKTGKEFDAFIQSCHIGLSTQQPDGKYNASSFPSKILMYLTNGLPVVSIKIPAVVTSSVGEYVYYYDIPTSENIAQTIQSVPLGVDLGLSKKLDMLDRDFKVELTELLQF